MLEEDDVLLGGVEDPSHHREDAAEADELIRWVLGMHGWIRHVSCGCRRV